MDYILSNYYKLFQPEKTKKYICICIFIKANQIIECFYEKNPY